MMTETYSVYRIVCFPTGKCYVGQAIDLINRYSSHFSLLKHGKHFNKHLQRAHDKYGRDLFYAEPLETDIDESEINQREEYWIEHFRSFGEGFNQTRGGNDRVYFSHECVWNGVSYKSKAAAARALGVHTQAICNWINKGYSCDDDIPEHKHPFHWNGVDYPSYLAAAKVLGCTPGAIKNWQERGYKSDDDLRNGDKTHKPCRWNSVTYESQTDAANAIGVPVGTFHKYIRLGYTCDADVPKKNKSGYPFSRTKPLVYNGVEYESQRQAARAIGIGNTSLRKRLKRGSVPSRGHGNGYSNSFAFNNIEYPSLTKAAEANGVCLQTMINWKNKGYTCDADMQRDRTA